VWKKVKLHPDCHVQFEKTYYSAPYRLVRQQLWLRATETTVQLFLDHELLATHPRLYRPGQRTTIDDHLPPEHLAYKRRDPQWCLRQAQTIGTACHTLLERLFAKHAKRQGIGRRHLRGQCDCQRWTLSAGQGSIPVK
jgi:hypothetical protein